MTSGGDGRLAVMAQQGDLDAEETLMRKYKETVRKKPGCTTWPEPMRTI